MHHNLLIRTCLINRDIRLFVLQSNLINILSMAKQNHSSVHHHYSTITLETRQALVDLVISMGFSIGRAARKMRVKLSTAKMIVKRFKTQGDFFESKRQREERTQIGQMRSSRRNKQIPQVEQDKTLEKEEIIQPSYCPAQEGSLLYFHVAFGDGQYWPWFPCQYSTLQQSFFVEPIAGGIYGYPLLGGGSEM